MAYEYNAVVYAAGNLSSIFHKALVILLSLLCLILSEPAYPQTLSLNEYVKNVLEYSNEAYSIESELQISDISKNIAEQRFEFEWTPSSQTSVSDGQNNVSMGIEGTRKTTWGPEFTVGVNRSFSGDDITTSYVEVNLGLFRSWGQRYIRSPLTIAEFSHNKVLLSATKREQELILSAIITYYQLGESRLLLRQSRESVERARRNLEVAESRQKLGLTDKVDVYRAELSLLDSRESHKRQQRSANRSNRTYTDLLGGSQAAPTKGESEIDQKLLTMSALYPQAWEDRIFSLNIDWQLHLIDREIAEQNLHVAGKNTYPDLQFFMSADNTHFQDSLREEDLDWTVGLRVSSSFSLSQERSVFNQERIRYQQLLRHETQLQRDIIAETRDAIGDYESISQRVKITETKLDQAEKALELTSLRFQRGLSSNLDQIETQESLNLAEVSVVRQRIERSLQAARIALTMGILTPSWLDESLGRVQ